ncbi:MAG: hypothetical protein IJA31_02345, partial [Clostridia bacterium]|nr:hypothetical protein [Clostridia bacterium]
MKKTLEKSRVFIWGSKKEPNLGSACWTRTNDLFKVRRFAPILYRNGKTIHRIVFPVSTDNSRKMRLWKHKEVGSRQQDESKRKST